MSAWVQFLNEHGEQVSAFNTPEELQTEYTPIEIVQMYKYKELDASTTVFVSTAQNFSYFLGIQNPKIGRYVLTYDYAKIFKDVNVFLSIF